jgi:formylmethanofuran dehydrogenase subunit E
MTFREIVRFHGHQCPGLAIGYRMAMAGIGWLEEQRALDEELVAITENDACGVDALQCVSGCTFGKGNLIFRDWGKQAYTLYSRRTRRGVRVLYHGLGVPEGAKSDRKAHTEWILSASPDSIISLAPVEMNEPEPARVMESGICRMCGERVMATRLVDPAGKSLCIPCSRLADRSDGITG